MKSKILCWAAGAALLMLLTGCTDVGQISGQTATSVFLGSKNYKVVKAGAMGCSSGFFLLGIIPITSPNYADAKASLYKSVGQSLDGRAIALANQTEDQSTLYAVLFSIPRVTLTADVIEFIDPAMVMNPASTCPMSTCPMSACPMNTNSVIAKPAGTNAAATSITVTNAASTNSVSTNSMSTNSVAK